MFRHAKSASDFKSIWDKEVTPYLNSTGEYCRHSDPTAIQPTTKRAPSAKPASSPALPPSKKAKLDETEQSAVDKGIEKCFYGKDFNCKPIDS